MDKEAWLHFSINKNNEIIFQSHFISNNFIFI